MTRIMNGTVAALAWLFAIASLVILPEAVAAMAALQSRAKSQPAGNLIIGTVAGEVGTTAAIPLYYQPSKNSSVASLLLEVEFVSNSVKFNKAEKGVASEGQEFSLAAEAKQLPPDDKKILRTRLTITVSAASSSQSLPEGLLAFLNFQIPEDAKPFSISLTPLRITARDAAHKAVDVAAEAGKVIVSIPDAPLAGCFFFTH